MGRAERDPSSIGGGSLDGEDGPDGSPIRTEQHRVVQDLAQDGVGRSRCSGSGSSPQHVSLVERLCGLAEAVASTGGPKARLRRSGAIGPSGSMAEHVAGRVTRLADDARVHAYEIMGDRERAVRIVERRLLAD